MQLPDQSLQASGKILDHDAGLGEVSEAMVEERARELAMIAGLPPERATNAHRRQASEELRGDADPNSPPADDDASIAEIIQYDEAPGSSGHAVAPATHAATHGDEETIGEQLYAEGVAEATHDRMVESRKDDLLDQREDDFSR
jgi:hypothetical protein